MTSSPHPDQPTPPPGGTAFFSWLRGLGLSRSDDRWLTGVASGIAAKAGIDPIIVRGIFVVLALLGGPGLLLYVIGWLLLPDARGRIVTEEIVRGRASAGVLTWAIVLTALVVAPAVLGVAGIASGSGPLSLWNWGIWAGIGLPGWITATVAWVFWIAVICGGLYWFFAVLPRRKTERDAARNSGQAKSGASAETPSGGQPYAAPFASPAGASSDAPHDTHADKAHLNGANADGASGQSDSAAQGSAEWASASAERAAEWGQRTAEQAAAWGERVGADAARRSEEWSAHVTQLHEARRLGAGHTVLTIATMLLAAGVTALAILRSDLALTVSSAAPPALIGGLIAALVVLAISLIITGIRGRHTGWVGFFAWCGVIALVITVVLPWGMRFQPFGDARITAVDAPGTVVLAGTVDVDLTSFDRFDAADSASKSTSATPMDASFDEPDLTVWLVAGNVNVDLPSSQPTIVNVRVLAGNISESERASHTASARTADGRSRTSGPFLTRTIRSNVTPETPAAEISTVDITLAAGNVQFDGAAGTDTASAATKDPAPAAHTFISSHEWELSR